MKNIQVKEIMIPISDYVTVKKENSLIDLLQALETDQRTKKGHTHRDAIVMDNDNNFTGKVTMIDIFQVLEPKYKKIDPAPPFRGVITRAFIMDALKNFDLWTEPMKNIRERAEKLKVKDAMHIPDDAEYIEEDDTLEKALHQYVMGVHQPLVVQDKRMTVGLLRFGDLFEVIRKRILTAD